MRHEFEPRDYKDGKENPMDNINIRRMNCNRKVRNGSGVFSADNVPRKVEPVKWRP